MCLFWVYLQLNWDLAGCSMVHLKEIFNADTTNDMDFFIERWELELRVVEKGSVNTHDLRFLWGLVC